MLPGDLNLPHMAVLVQEESENDADPGSLNFVCGFWCSSAAAWKLRHLPQPVFNELFPTGCTFIVGGQTYRYLNGTMTTGFNKTQKMYKVVGSIVFAEYARL